MADACVYLMQTIDFKDIIGTDALASVKDEVETSLPKEVINTHINIGTGVDISIKELALTIKNIVGYKGELYFNTTKPDGTMIKLTDPSKLNALGWRFQTELEDGIKAMYEWYLKQEELKWK